MSKAYSVGSCSVVARPIRGSLRQGWRRGLVPARQSAPMQFLRRPYAQARRCRHREERWGRGRAHHVQGPWRPQPEPEPFPSQSRGPTSTNHRCHQTRAETPPRSSWSPAVSPPSTRWAATTSRGRLAIALTLSTSKGPVSVTENIAVDASLVTLKLVAQAQTRVVFSRSPDNHRAAGLGGTTAPNSSN